MHIDVQAHGQFLGDPVQQQPRTAVRADLQQFRSDDGDDPLFFNKAKQILPGVIVHGGAGQNSGRRLVHEPRVRAFSLVRLFAPLISRSVPY